MMKSQYDFKQIFFEKDLFYSINFLKNGKHKTLSLHKRHRFEYRVNSALQICVVTSRFVVSFKDEVKITEHYNSFLNIDHF